MKDSEASKLGRQFVYTHLASLPSKAAHAEEELRAARKVWERRSELPLSEVAVYGTFLAECIALFVVGEVVGRGSLIDYKV